MVQQVNILPSFVPGEVPPDRETASLLSGGVEGDEGCVPEIERIQFQFIFTGSSIPPKLVE